MGWDIHVKQFGIKTLVVFVLISLSIKKYTTKIIQYHI